MAILRRARQARRSPANRVLFGVTCTRRSFWAPCLWSRSRPRRPAPRRGASTLSPALNGLEGLNTISCPDTSYCVALDSNQDEGDTLVWNGGTWSAVPLVEPGGALQLDGVSSASESLCFAVGEESGAGPGPGDVDTGVIEKWNGSAWSRTNPQERLMAMSPSPACPVRAPPACVAVGMDSTDGGFSSDSWSGGSWTQAYSSGT